jgi:hypothetical protein
VSKERVCVSRESVYVSRVCTCVSRESVCVEYNLNICTRSVANICIVCVVQFEYLNICARSAWPTCSMLTLLMYASVIGLFCPL